MTDEIERLIDLERLEDGTQIVDHAGPLEPPVRRGCGITMTAQVDGKAPSNVEKALGDATVAVAVEAGGVDEYERRPLTAELVERDRDSVARGDVLGSTLPVHESLGGSGRMRWSGSPTGPGASRRAMRVTL